MKYYTALMEKASKVQKNIYFCFIDYSKKLCGSQQTVENSSGDGNIRSPYLPPEKSVCMSGRTGGETTVSFKIRKGVHQGYILSPCLFNLNVEYIMRNVGLDEAQTGIKTARRNINNLGYADGTTLMAESEEELKEPLDESERGE